MNALNQQFLESMVSGKISHCYLFYGNDTVSLLSMAEDAARKILQVNDLEVSGRYRCVVGDFKIDEARELMEYANKKQGKAFVVTIDSFDRLNRNVQNLFLKTIEEPPVGLVIILTATTSVLKTIESRATIYRVFGGLTGGISDLLSKKEKELDRWQAYFALSDMEGEDIMIAISEYKSYIKKIDLQKNDLEKLHILESRLSKNFNKKASLYRYVFS